MNIPQEVTACLLSLSQAVTLLQGIKHLVKHSNIYLFTTNTPMQQGTDINTVLSNIYIISNASEF